MVLEYHKSKDTIDLSKADKAEWAAQTSAKRQQVAEQWITDQGWTGTVTVDPAEIPETDYLVLDPWKDVNEIHDALLEAGQIPSLVEQGADGSWMRLTFDYDDVTEARKIIEG